MNANLRAGIKLPRIIQPPDRRRCFLTLPPKQWLSSFSCSWANFGASRYPDQINVPLGGCNAFRGFILKGVQNVNPLANLDRQHDPVGVRGVPQGNLKDATRPPLLVP